MITEDYVSFEVAKLLKEKGFSGECFQRYSLINDSGWQGDVRYKLSIGERYNSEVLYIKDSIQCPTYQMAMKWLREACAIEISIVCFELDCYRYDVYEINSSDFRRLFIDFCSDEFCSYEEAAEAAIKYCLENLI